MKKILSVLLVLSMILTVSLFAGCAKKDTSVADIQARGEVVMYTNAAFPPFEYMRGEEVVGVDVDIANAIARELGVKLTIKNVEFDTIVGSIKSGKGDFGAAGMTVTDERMESVDFSTKYIKSRQYVIVTKDSEAATIEDLAGMKIGVQEGTTGDFTISDAIDLDDGALFEKGSSILHYNNALDASIALMSGKIDAVVIDQLPAQNIAAVNDGLKALELVYADGSDTEEEYAICVNKNNKALLTVINTVVERLIADGSVDRFIVEHSNEAAA